MFLLVAGLRRVKDPLYLAESISGGCDALAHWCDKPIRAYVPWLNPLTPKSDQHLISPYSITPESHNTVMRIKEMITNSRNS